MIRLKNIDEINKIRDASKLLARTYTALLSIIDEGITTGELDAYTYDFIIKHGGKPAFLGYLKYPATLCSSINQEVIHGIPGNRKLKNGDILSLDLGVALKGFISDAAVTIPIGPITDQAKQLLDVTKQCLYLGIEQAIAGNRVRDISRAIFNNATKYKYGVVHQFCGHGVGNKVHEEPQIPNYISSGPSPRLKPGMVLAIEPMINEGVSDVVINKDGWTVETADKKLSAHFEHTIAIFQDHTEILTDMDNN